MHSCGAPALPFVIRKKKVRSLPLYSFGMMIGLRDCRRLVPFETRQGPAVPILEEVLASSFELRKNS